MTSEQDRLADPRIQAALTELQGMIRGRYPEATFETFIGYGDDPNTVYLRATLDVEDTDEAADVFIDRLVDLRVEDGLPISVHIARTPERNEAVWRAIEAEAAARASVT